MPDIPNPFGAFEIYPLKKMRATTKSKSNQIIIFINKIFNFKILDDPKVDLTSAKVGQASSKIKIKKRLAYKIEWAGNAAAIKEAQRLRYEVFADEMGAKLSKSLEDLDADEFDIYCDHLLVREQASLKVVGTYRVLPPHKAQEIGRLYSDSEFDLSQINYLRPKIVELGRSCVHRDYRSGAVIMSLWSGLAQYMLKNGYEIMLGCASIPMNDGGHFAASLYKSLRNDQMAPLEFHAFPKHPLPLDELNGDLAIEAPPLIKGYLKLGAKICGAPAWDPNFNTADLLTMLRLSDINPRYAKHFLGA